MGRSGKRELPLRRGSIKQRIFEQLAETIRKQVEQITIKNLSDRTKKGGSYSDSCIVEEECGSMSDFGIAVVSHPPDRPQGSRTNSDLRSLANVSDLVIGDRIAREDPEEEEFLTPTGLIETEELINLAPSSEVVLGEDVQSSTIHEKHVLKCKLYLFLFRLDCEFDKDSMVQLWVADGIFEPYLEERMEILAGAIFDSLVETQFIVPSTFDNVFGLLKYRLNTSIISAVDHDETANSDDDDDDDDDYLVVNEAQLVSTSKMTKHLSIICESFDLRTAEVLKGLKYLRTLILFSESGTSINHVPHDLFLYLKHLRTLDLHEFSVSELPSSIGNLKSLRYLDVSGAPISSLPESVDSLGLLETLKLKGCFELQRLPKNMCRLSCLRHLDLDIVGQLDSMPKGMGSLTRLKTLSAFVVGRDDGCGVKELKNLVNLTGSFCISRLENICNPGEAGEAELSNKKYLARLQLRWGGRHHDGSDAEDAILECLQPHFGIKELDILFFNGARLPTWMSNSSFTEIVSISLFQCRNCCVLPSLGRLPSLKFLEIYEMNAVRVIDHSFCGNDGGQETLAFPKLETLTIDGMSNLAEWTGMGDGDFPSLLEFKLKYCPKLLTVPFLSKLQSLKFLEVTECTGLQFSYEDVLPASLEILIVKDCPRLKNVFSPYEGRPKMIHLSSLFLDHEEIYTKGPAP